MSVALNVILTSPALTPARNQMALSLGAHIIIACFGIALPAMIFVFHRMGLRGNADALELAKRWSKVSGILFAIGAVSGTILSFEMGLLWPVLMERYGEVIGLAFALEGISFFIEAIFLGMYVYSWGKVEGRLHSLMLLPMMISGLTGSFFVISVNAWMNSPTGFTEAADGTIIDVDPVAAIFNDAVWLNWLHMLIAAYMVAGFCAAGVYAKALLSGKNTSHNRLGLMVPLVFAVLITPMQPLVGHFAGQRVAQAQPIKFAAISGIAETESSVPVIVGSRYSETEQKMVGGFEVPIDGLESFLATNDFDGEIVGFNDAPEADRPPINVPHFAFGVMVGIGTALTALSGWAAFRWFRKRDTLFESRWFLRSLIAAGPATIIAMEAGWITTEVGRQPWIVYGKLRTADAVTDSSFIWVTLITLTVGYILIGIGAVAVLRSMTRRWAAGEKDITTPYGPPTPLSHELSDEMHT